MHQIPILETDGSSPFIRSCDICGDRFKSIEAYAGHRSGHSRSGESTFRNGSFAWRLNHFPDEIFIEAFTTSISFAMVYRKLAMEDACGSRVNEVLIERAKKLGLNMDHMLGQRSPSPRKVLSIAGSKNPSIQRRLLLERHGNVCWSCGLDSWLGEPITLQIDHIDGDRKNSLPENLRLLCGTCHTMTPTWGNKKRS